MSWQEEFQMHWSTGFFQRRWSKVIKWEERTRICASCLTLQERTERIGLSIWPSTALCLLISGDTYLNIFYVCNMLWWFNPSQEPSPTQPLAHSLTSGIRERRGRVKAGKLMGWASDSLIGGRKSMYTSKAKQGINSLLPMVSHPPPPLLTRPFFPLLFKFPCCLFSQAVGTYLPSSSASTASYLSISQHPWPLPPWLWQPKADSANYRNIAPAEPGVPEGLECCLPCPTWETQLLGSDCSHTDFGMGLYSPGNKYRWNKTYGPDPCWCKWAELGQVMLVYTAMTYPALTQHSSEQVERHLFSWVPTTALILNSFV